MRLDVFLTESHLTLSRTEAKKFIEEGAVTVNGKVVKKPAFEVFGSEKIEIDKSSKKYVSRGGNKLEAAINEFSIHPQGRLAIDIGASSGGFTDCLLKNGAKHVIAIDSGTAQLAGTLINDNRVTSIENYNARYLSINDLLYSPDLAVMDVSFISSTYIIPSLFEVLTDNSDFICLIKPQFEVGKANIGKGGIVKDEKARENAVTKVVDFAKSIGFDFMGCIKSPIVGGDGNVEFLAHFKKN